jgi:hypothetical protein
MAKRADLDKMNVMAELSNALKQKLEHLFGMSSGYVLDFSNASFSDFIQTSIGVNPYENRPGSKAVVLRRLWIDLDPARFSTLTHEMLDRWHTNKLVNNETISPAEQKLFDETIAAVRSVGENDAGSATDTAFLEKDFGHVDLAKIQVPLSHQEIVQQRMDEIDRCLKVEAPLAVVFLCGSTLEGLLAEVASKNPADYNRAKGAPQSRGAVKPPSEWTLENLIVVSRELGIIGEDVVKHAHAVKDFRNYIHPRQQLKENFKPRMFTAKMAQQVLLAALHDLSDS